MIHMRHEVRKLESDNEKLRQTLKQKMNLKTANTIPISAKPTMSNNQDDFYEMVRDGFFEQINSMNDEIQKSQQFSLTITKWLFDTFQIKLIKQMAAGDIEKRLAEVSERLKETERTRRISVEY